MKNLHALEIIIMLLAMVVALITLARVSSYQAGIDGPGQFLRERKIMNNPTNDQSVLQHIERLVSEEHQLYSHGSLQETERERLTKIQVELDQCWDLLRQRRALRDVGRDPDEAHVRGANVVENYEQ